MARVVASAGLVGGNASVVDPRTSRVPNMTCPLPSGAQIMLLISASWSSVADTGHRSVACGGCEAEFTVHRFEVRVRGSAACSFSIGPAAALIRAPGASRPERAATPVPAGCGSQRAEQ